jgi:hypothetical protein
VNPVLVGVDPVNPVNPVNPVLVWPGKIGYKSMADETTAPWHEIKMLPRFGGR